MKRYAVISGVGGALPSKMVTNDDLSLILETSDSWIQERTGILQRNLSASLDIEDTSDLGFVAAQEALKDAQCDPREIDMILVATSTPDRVFPPCAVRVQDLLGAVSAVAFDVNVACSGFVFALSIAETYLKQGIFSKILVVGAETLSKIVDWQDRRTAVLFGDGAGAVVLEKQETLDESSARELARGIIDTSLFTQSKGYDSLYVTKMNDSVCPPMTIQMNGQEVFRHAVTYLEGASRALLEKNNILPRDLDWVVPHQANKRIIDSVTNRLKIDPEKVLCTIEGHANTSSASIPLTLWKKKELLRKGDLILLQAFGAGFTGAVTLLRW
jgi:3-oxoacyl-[acyl-carrier-protein] synthase III